MDIDDLRKEIDRTDAEILRLFAERMDICAGIAEYKKENGLPVYDPRREREKINAVIDSSPEHIKDYSPLLYSLIMELSRSYQNKLISSGSALSDKIKYASKNTAQVFPEHATVACQGIDGANSQLACDKLFRSANIMYFSSFDAVFTAIEKGMCKYGVIPVENSAAGSVNSVYDLMMGHNFHIVRSLRLKVDHNLLALPGAKLSGISEIWSHEQAIAQCSEFLQKQGGVKIVLCENTAVAAKLVAASGRTDVASLSSKQCMDFYGLDCLAESVQNTDNNYTRFICITKDLEIYPGADRTSLMVTLPHEAGSLYKLLSRFYALGINLNKLESRPIPSREFEFMFYFDLDIPVQSPKFLQLISELPYACDKFSYLGSYGEVI